ncbi:MAG: hypothetical protein Q7U60_00190 [Candidatus Methanoperedens sp.]|nr:hypothetical protein [Candidatus Methanoperedens sp.]
MIGENAGDSVIGERIVCEARIVSKPVLIHRTGKHRAQRLKLTGNPAVCWIEKPIREKV